MIAAAAALLLAGCGSDAGTAATTAATAASTSSSTTSSASTTTLAAIVPTGAEAYATAFVEAWSTGDRATAELLGTADAVDTVFSGEGGGTWTLTGCEGAAGSSYCTFSAGGDPTVIVRVMNEAAQRAQPHAVGEVRFEG